MDEIFEHVDILVNLCIRGRSQLTSTTDGGGGGGRPFFLYKMVDKRGGVVKMAQNRLTSTVNGFPYLQVLIHFKHYNVLVLYQPT